MTADQFRAALATLTWKPGHLAPVLGCSRDLPLKWASGRASVPPAVASWLRALASAHARHPSPQDWRTRSA